MSQSTPRRIRQLHRHLLTTHRGPTGPAPAAAESIGDLRTPALVLRLDVAAANVARMQARADSLGCALRPHVKTHKTLELGALQTGGTRRRITVSTLAEAQFFADGGFDDILYAVPITPDKLGEAAALTRRLDAFHVICDHPTQLEAILALARPAPDKPWSVFIMVDCGYHRDGVDPDSQEALEMAAALAAGPDAALAGIYTHGGHSYDADDVDAVRAIGATEVILPTAPSWGGCRTKGRVLGSWSSCRLFLGPGFRLAARWHRLVETVKTRKQWGKTGGKWARYDLKRAKEEDAGGITWRPGELGLKKQQRALTDASHCSMYSSS